MQNAIAARHSEPARTLAWESVLYSRGNGLPQPLRGFAMTREGHFATRPRLCRERNRLPRGKAIHLSAMSLGTVPVDTLSLLNVSIRNVPVDTVDKTPVPLSYGGFPLRRDGSRNGVLAESGRRQRAAPPARRAGAVDNRREWVYFNAAASGKEADGWQSSRHS